MNRHVPEMAEVFEQSREYLDVLRSGEFVNRGRAEINSDLFISYRDGRLGAPYEEWDTIGWLTYEEREAILFLMRSEEPGLNFLRIASDREDGTLIAELYRQPPEGARVADIMDIWYGEGHRSRGSFYGELHDSRPVNLGDGYTLWMHTIRTTSAVPMFCTCRRR